MKTPEDLQLLFGRAELHLVNKIQDELKQFDVHAIN